MEKLSIHRGLAELKLLDAKIERATNKHFIGYKPSIADKIGGVAVTEIVQDMKSSYQSVTDLIARRTKIKSAIIKSNALTTVSFMGKEITVAEVIDEKTTIQYSKNLLQEWIKQYNNNTARVAQVNEKVNKDSEEFINNLYKDKSQVDTNKIKDLKEDYIAKNQVELINPNDLKKKIDELSNYIDDFEANADFVLSESNAVTFIEI